MLFMNSCKLLFLFGRQNFTFNRLKQDEAQLNVFSSKFNVALLFIDLNRLF